uniref:Protein FAR1-RELATED SEQUENCE n=1 Tax=Lactuca sativa TaxID=4236 RepID=A0A9R1W005_LACSA|nr:hypothetical protein LSAT_V11C400218510 [Lactuca sativa]
MSYTDRSSSSYHIFYSDISLMENKDNVDNNNKDFSDNNGRNNNLMLHMIMFLLVDHLIGFLLFRTISNLKSIQLLNHIVQHYQCITTLAGFDEGKPRTAKVDTLDTQHNKIQRRKDSFRCECKAEIVFILVHGTNKYIVAEFIEQHNHGLFGKDNMFLSRTKRKLNYSQEMFIHNLSKQNIGASRAHRLYTGLQGGSDIRGGLVSDFKNSTRNLNSYIGSRDAKFLVVKMLERKKIPNFSFEFKVVQKKLNAIFWVDETAKYDTVFVPFTGIDNHKKCVTFGAGLLSREDVSSYSWLLRVFLKEFKKQTTLVLTNQDPALNKAVNEVFPVSSHMFCMWHITKKLPNKAWQSCLHEFNISNNKWMQEMYGLHRHRVPAFFKDIPMFGLMRTTSLSEDQNWSFQNNTLNDSYLLMFMMTFEGVRERQRHNQFVNDFNTSTTLPRFITSSPIELHASKVQKEISDSDNTCFQMSVTSNNGVDTIIVLEKQKNISTILYNKYSYIIIQIPGYTLKNRWFIQIPEEYIMRRLRQDVIPTELLKRHRCVSFLSHDAAKLKSYLEELNKLKKKFVDDCPAPEMPSRESFYNQIISVELTNDVPDIENPSDIRNKGTGSRGKRLKSKKEMLEKVSSKPKRKCALHKQMVNHDKQNCPLKKRNTMER